MRMRISTQLATALLGLTAAACGEDTPSVVDCATLADRYDTSTTLPKGCYLAKTTPILASGVVLTLEPGVEIVFSLDVALSFTGDQGLVAVGTPAEPIVLRGAEATRGFWTGLLFSETGARVQRLEHVIVRHAGSKSVDPRPAAIKQVAGTQVQLALRSCTLDESAGFGLWLEPSAVVTGFAANTLTKNSLGPASVASEVAQVLDATSHYVGNDVDRVEVRANRVTADVLWASLDVPYALTDTLQVDRVLSLAPGLRLIMANASELMVSGSEAALEALGTAALPISITGAQAVPGSWGAIVFTNTAHARNKLHYVTVEYAGGGGEQDDLANVVLTGTGEVTSVELMHSTLRHSGRHGLAVYGMGRLPGFADNTLTQNALGAARMASESAHGLDSTSRYVGNTIDEITVDTNRVRESVTWRAVGVPYIIDAVLQIDGVWTLEPGVTLKMKPSTSSLINGGQTGMNAVGTAAAPIVITGTERTPGSWRSIIFSDTTHPSNVFEHVTVEYAGGSLDQDDVGAIVLTSAGQPISMTLRSSTIQHNLQHGLYLSRNATVNADVETANTWADNAGGNVYREQ